MDGFNGDGNGSEFNVGASGTGSEFDLAGNDNVSDYYDGRRTRNLFSLAPPGSGSGDYNSYTSVPPPLSSSTIPSPGELRMSGLNVNGSEGWPNIDAYEGILRSGDQAGGIGSSRGPPPVRVPPCSGGVHTAPVHRQHRPASRSRGARRRGAGPAVAGDNNPPVSNEITRAKWNKDDTKKFCEIYCTQIDLGNCKNGNMTKWGWKDVQDRFRAATGKLHDSEQFGHKYRQLKQLWLFIEDLRHKATGLGRREDGSVVASDKWWEDHCKGKQDWMELKDGWPEYIDELDRMFAGVAVNGETSFVPGVSRRLHYVSSGEDEADHDQVTPMSCATPVSSGSKRSSSTRSDASSPSKKSKSAAVRSMDANMSRFNFSYENRTALMQNCWKARQQQVAALDEEKNMKKEEQKLVAAAAREVGAHKIQGLWVGVINICKDDDARTVFLETPVEARLEVIKHYAGEVVHQVNAQVNDDDDWWEEFWNMLLEDDDEAAFIYGTYCCRKVLPGGLGVCKPPRVSVSLPADQVSHPRLSKRPRTTRVRGLSSTRMESASTTVPSIVVYVTVPNREAGKKLSHSIISEKLAACVNIVPGIESVYWWEGKVQSDAEELLIIKTRESLLDALTAHVKANHEYDVPEVIALPITGGNTKYLEWLKNSTRYN